MIYLINDIGLLDRIVFATSGSSLGYAGYISGISGKRMTPLDPMLRRVFNYAAGGGHIACTLLADTGRQAPNVQAIGQDRCLGLMQNLARYIPEIYNRMDYNAGAQPCLQWFPANSSSELTPDISDGKSLN